MNFKEEFLLPLLKNNITIDTLGQLVGINNLWWERSKERYEGWSNPDSMWISLLKEFGYIKEKTKTIIYYE